MPTINQLVRQERKQPVYKSKAPALGKRWDSLNKTERDIPSPQKKGVCTRVGTRTRRSRTLLLVSTPVSVYPMAMKSLPTSAVKDITFRNTKSF